MNRLFSMLMIVALLLTLAACSSSDSGSTPTDTASAPEPSASTENVPPPETASVTQIVNADEGTIVITSNDAMQFNIKEFTATAGKEVTITLKNIGKLAKNLMGHNLIILEKGVDPIKWGLAVGENGGNYETDWLPTDQAALDQIIIHTKLLGPGEEETISFTAPEAGEYAFLCSFTGHVGVMNGKMIVRAAN